MKQEINLLSKLPRGKRNVNARAEAKTDEIIAISRQYGELYFDGPRKYGYGGYRYDGRWIPVAEDMVKHFDLKPGDRVLDVGCGKGFLVKDLIKKPLPQPTSSTRSPGLRSKSFTMSSATGIHRPS